MAVLTYRDALNAALREEMQRDDNVFLMGEEVAEYDGAYKVSRGLLKEFGARRVVDTPIAELGFTGIGVGAAMVGLRPVIEMMTMNFALLAIDQIVNTAAKVRYMSGGQIGCPLVIRGPGGAALQLGAQHSQAFESWYANIPGLKVVMPATPADAKGLLKSAIRDDNPVIFIEGEMLYNQKGEVPDGEHLIPLGRADIKRPGNDVTIICHSKTVAPASHWRMKASTPRWSTCGPYGPSIRMPSWRRSRKPIASSWPRRVGASPAWARRSSTSSSVRRSTISIHR